MSAASLFPEWDAKHPPPMKPPPKPWRPSRTQEQILTLLRNRGPMDDQELVRAMLSDLTPKATLSALDTLGRRGLIRDTGERGQWTSRGRTTVWRVA